MRHAIGERGSWFASIDGERYPCVHTYWYNAPHYHDPNAVPGQRQWDELIAAVREKRCVILTNDEVVGDGMAFSRTGYIGLFEVADIEVSGSHLRFRFVRRIESLA